MAVFRRQWDQLQDWSERWMQRESGSLDRFLVDTAAASTDIPRLQGSGSCPVCFGAHASHKGETGQGTACLRTPTQRVGAAVPAVAFNRSCSPDEGSLATSGSTTCSPTCSARPSG